MNYLKTFFKLFSAGPAQTTSQTVEQDDTFSPSAPREINLLLLGETGVGKSTFINSFANYLFYSTIKEALQGDIICPIPSMFTITNQDYQSQTIFVGDQKIKGEVYKPGESATQGCKCYEFKIPAHNPKILLRLIDTPGIGDVRGVASDDYNFENILQHLSLYDHLNGICILLKPNNSRITLAFRYCIKELLKHLHKNAKDNIFFCFTNSRGTFYRPGDTLPTLWTLLDDLEKTTHISIPLTSSNMYCFDNEAFRFLSAVKCKVQFPIVEQEEFAKSWERAAAENQRLFLAAVSVQPHKLKETISLNEARKFLKQLAHPISRITQSIDKNVKSAKAYQQELLRTGTEVSLLEAKKKWKITRPTVKDLGYPRTVCSVEKVVSNGLHKSYTQICHSHCYVSGVSCSKTDEPLLQGCEAITNGRCHCGHDWRVHMHISYEIVDEEVEVEREDIVQKIQMLSYEKISKQTEIESINKRIVEETSERADILKINAKFATFLKRNAITPYNDDLKAYLIQQIKDEEESGNNQDTLSSLQNSLQVYQAEVQSFLAAIERGEPECSIEDIPLLVNQLYDLRYNGATIQNLVTGISRVVGGIDVAARLEVTVQMSQPNHNRSIATKFMQGLLSIFK